MTGKPRIFYLYREQDATGVSGTGVVAEGIWFSDGSCALRWRTKTSSTAVYGTLSDVLAIHGHHGQTYLVDQWGDPFPGEDE